MLDIATLGIRVDSRQVRDASRDLNRLGSTSEQTENQVTRASAALKRMAQMAATVAAALAVVEAVKLADEMALLDARLKLATTSMHEFAQATRDVYDIAQKNSVSIQSLTDLYVKLSDPIRRVGGGMNEVRGVVDAFSTAMRVGGASSEDAARAVLQFSQAMGQGKLSGDEFNAIAETSPRFLKAIAEGANLPIEQLKKLGAEGKLTADVVGNALLKSLDQLNKEAAAMPDTVGGAFTRLKNDIAVAVKDINKATQGTQGIAGMVDQVGKLIPLVKNELVAAFIAVDEWLTANRDRLAEAFDKCVMLVGQVWELFKAVGALGGEVAEAGLKFGIISAAITGATLLVAGLQDGVKLVSASFIAVGGSILEYVLKPILNVLDASAKVAGLFNDELSGSIEGVASEIRGAFKSAGDYVRGVEKDFASGNTEVNRLMRNIYGADSATLSLATSGKKAAEAYKALRTGGPTEEQKKAAEKAAKALAQATKAAKDYAESQERERAMLGLTERQQIMYNAAKAAAVAPTQELKEKIILAADALGREKEAQEAVAKARKAAEDAISEDAQTLLDLDKRIAGLNLEIRLHGMTADAAVEAELAKARATASSLAISETYREELNKQIAKLEEIKRLQGKLAGMDKTKAAMKEAADANAKMADSMRESITDALMRGFESGKGFASNMWAAVRNMIKTQALTPLVNGAVGAALGTFGFGGTASAATGGGSGILGAGLSGIAGSIGTGAFQTAGAILSGQIGLGSTLSAGLSAIGTGTASGIASGLSSVVGALGPVALGLGAVALVLKKGFGSGPKEVTRTSIDGTFGPGGFMGNINETWKKEGGWFTSDKGGVDRKAVDSEMVAALNQTYTALKTSTASYLETLGISGEWLMTRSQNLSVALTGDAQKDQAAISSFFAKISDDIALEFVPSLAQFQQAGESASATLQRLATNYATVDAVLTSLGLALSSVGVGSLAARERLVANSGGSQAFAANAAAFAQNFLTEDQRNAPILAAVRKELDALGYSAVDTREEFAAAVLALDPFNEAQSVTFGKLMQLQGAFAQVYPAIDKTKEAAEKAAAALALSNAEKALEAQELRLLGQESAALRIERDLELAGMNPLLRAQQERVWMLADEKAITEKRASLEIQLMRASGDAAGALEAERKLELAALDASLRPLQELIWAREAENEANKAAADKAAEFMKLAAQFSGSKGIEAIPAAAAPVVDNSEALRVANELASIEQDELQLERQILALKGEHQKLRDLELAALAPGNVEAKKRVHALQDEIEAINKANKIAGEREGLERQLLQLQGDTAKLRALDLAKIDPANRALQQHIWAMQDQAEAARNAAAAVAKTDDVELIFRQAMANIIDRAVNAWREIGNSLMDEVKRIRGMMEVEGVTSLAEAQSRFTTASAQARAGDYQAAKMLPELSRALLDMAAEEAVSKQELALIRAATAASLQATAGVASTRNFRDVGEARAWTPERATPNAATASGNESALLAELRDLRRETKRSADMMEILTNGGEAMRVTNE